MIEIKNIKDLYLLREILKWNIHKFMDMKLQLISDHKLGFTRYFDKDTQYYIVMKHYEAFNK